MCPPRRSATTAQHAQPQEQERREFIGPDQRRIEHVTGDDAAEQDGDLGEHQRGADRFGHRADDAVEQEGDPAQPCRWGSRQQGCIDTIRRQTHARVPTYFSSSAQAWSPIFAFISG
jgi:hypothetical protein